jgi:TetR/AcrR family tetracycline transcriptional repressor
MSNDDNLDRNLARIEDAQRRAQERLERQQERINKRFDGMRERMTRKYGSPNEGQQRIIEAALELLKQDGLNNLSLRKLAATIDMRAPALYWYFKNKEVLIDFMAEAILQKQFKDLQPRQPEETWQVWLADCMRRLRNALLAYPDGGRVVAGAHIYPALTLGNIYETVLMSLNSDGIELETARRILMTSVTYTFGFVIEEQSAPTQEEVDMLGLDAYMAPYPHIVEAMQAAHSDNKSFNKDYDTGLQYVIRGSTF